MQMPAAVESVGHSKGQSESQFPVSESPYQASGWATLAEKQKCYVGLEDNTACYGQEKK